MLEAMQPTLYLMLGYPGAGKTTVARLVHSLTGAEHFWADDIRREMFGNPTYSADENKILYDELNRRTAELLSAGKSVVFDTSFNYRKDRDHLRTIARDNGAASVLLWVQTDKDIAHDRATQDAHLQETRALGNMHPDDFHRLSDKMEIPDSDEEYITVDGTIVAEAYIEELLRKYRTDNVE